MRISLRLLFAVGLCLAARHAPATEPGTPLPPAPAGQASLVPILVCPPKYSTPLFIPADELLREANELQPPTPDGWIVQNRPVTDCVNDLGDAGQRFREQFDLPLQLRRYNSQIRLLEAEAASLQRRMANYRYFNKAGALFVTVENTRLAYVAVQEQLRNLRYERTLFIRRENVERQLSQGVPVESRDAS